MEKTVDAIQAFKAERILGPDGKPYISNGFSPEIPDMEGVEYFSASRLKEMRESPKHFEWKYIKGNRSPETPGKKFGKLLHWSLLQPRLFLSRYVIKPKFEGTGSRALAKEWDEKHQNNIVVKEDEAEEIDLMIRELTSNPRASKLLSNGTPEVATFYRDHELKDEKGLPINWFGIIDFYRSGNWIVEVKTTKKATWKSFKKDAYDYGYHLQSWKYRRMVEGITGKKPDYAIIAIESGPPYCVQIFEPDQGWWDHANYEAILALNDYRQCKNENYWPAYSRESVRIGGPSPWMKSRFEEEAYE